MLSDAQRAIIRKDVMSVTASRMLWMPMVFLPVVFSVVMPLGVLATAVLLGELKADTQELIRNLRITETFSSPRAAFITMFAEYVFPLLFLVIPLMVTSVLGANSLVGERERHTLETLLYGPLTVLEVFTAKVAGVLVPAWVVMCGSALVFGTIMDVGGYLVADVVPFPSWRWVVVLFWLAPALIVAVLVLLTAISARAQTTQEAQQASAIVVVPVVLAMGGQMAGVLMLDIPVLLLAGAVLLALDVVFLRRVARAFTPEKLL